MGESMQAPGCSHDLRLLTQRVTRTKGERSFTVPESHDFTSLSVTDGRTAGHYMPLG